MHCYHYEALCRTLVECVKERYPNMDYDLMDAAEDIDRYGIDSVARYADIVSVARNVGFGIKLAA